MDIPFNSEQERFLQACSLMHNVPVSEIIGLTLSILRVIGPELQGSIIIRKDGRDIKQIESLTNGFSTRTSITNGSHESTHQRYPG